MEERDSRLQGAVEDPDAPATVEITDDELAAAAKNGVLQPSVVAEIAPDAVMDQAAVADEVAPEAVVDYPDAPIEASTGEAALDDPDALVQAHDVVPEEATEVVPEAVVDDPDAPIEAPAGEGALDDPDTPAEAHDVLPEAATEVVPEAVVEDPDAAIESPDSDAALDDPDAPVQAHDVVPEDATEVVPEAVVDDPDAPIEAPIETPPSEPEPPAGDPDPGEPPVEEAGSPETPVEEPTETADSLTAEQLLIGTEQPEGDAESEESRHLAILEAIVYITDEPLSKEQIAKALGEPLPAVTRLLDRLVEEYNKPHHGLTVKEVAGGFKMSTKAEHHEAVRTFVKNLNPPLKLSLAALETLAVIAYKQPITAPEIMEIRGVQGAGVLKTLIDRKLITTAGRKNVVGKPILYKTTKEFLVQFGLRDLSELPTLKEFEDLRRMAFSEADSPADVVDGTPVVETVSQPNNE